MAEQKELDRELYSLLKKEGVDPRTFAGVAAGLQAELERPVPMRPAFKAELRARLMAEAASRRPARWFQRPALWSALGGVAAVFVLVVGLRLFTATPTPAPETGRPTTPTTPQPVGSEDPRRFLVNKTTLPLVQVPDESQTGAPTPSGTLETAKELPAYKLTGTVDAGLVKGLAERLAFREPAPVAEGDHYRVTDGARVIQVSRSGAFRYEDAAAGQTKDAPAVTEGQAVQVANQFLQRAALPVVDLDPAVAREAETFLVSYEDRYEGRPIIGGSTRVWVSRGGSVRRVESFTPAGEEYVASYEAVAYADAVKAAEAKGGHFYRGDLVWVRTTAEQTVYLQPYWRLFGEDASGPIIRYVPALQR
jgi:hypothetical protein